MDVVHRLFHIHDGLRSAQALGLAQYQLTACEWAHAPHGVP